MKFKTGINKYVVTETTTENKEDIFSDDYVTKCMGSFGYWQALIYPITASTRLMVVWNIVSIVFLTPTTQFSCEKFRNGTNVNTLDIKNSTCYTDCVAYEYHTEVFEETLISRFGLICEKAWLKSFTQTCIMFGLVLGVSLSGWISDRFGRRKAFLLATSIAVIFMLASPFAPSYWIFNVLRIFVGLGIGGIMTLGIVVNIEMVGQKYREIAGALTILPDGIGQIVITFIAYHTTTWQSLLLAYGVISLVLLLMLPVVPETPRWLVSQRRGDEAIAIMTKVAEFNNLSTCHIRDTVNKAIEDIQSRQKELKKYHMTDLFRTTYLTKITIASFIMWTSGGICFFGLNQYSTLLGLNIYVVVPLMGLIQIIGPISALPINKILGRKMSCFCCFCMIGTAMVVLIFIPDGHWGCTFTTGIGIFFAIILFSVTYTQVNELYPTPLRNMGLGMSSAGAKIGAMISPFIANTHPHWVASTIFAAVPFVGAVFSLLLPETKGKPLKDTIE